MIAQLITKGHAYVAADGSGDVYFDVRSWPSYGELSHQKIDDMEPAGDADPRGKRDPRDFALWKGFKKEEEPATAAWPAPWGLGRPGWHLECSAMSGKYLGDEFDIHGGGLDLRFPHHENELAQSRAAGRPFARIWMHNAMVNLAGEKMSKSVGNALLVSEVIKQVRPIELRYYLIAPHYRSIIEFSFESLREAATAFQRIEGFVVRGTGVTGGVDPSRAVVCAEFAEAMDDDLSVPAALAALQGLIREGNKLLAGGDSPALRGNLAAVRRMLDLLGLDPLSDTWTSTVAGGEAHALRQSLDRLVGSLVEERERARLERDFATADRVRGELQAAGIEVEDTSTGPRWTVLARRSAGRAERWLVTASGRERSASVREGTRRPALAAGSNGASRGAARHRRRRIVKVTRPFANQPRSSQGVVGRRPLAAVPRERPSTGSSGATRSSRRWRRTCRRPPSTSPSTPSATTGCGRRSSLPRSATSRSSRCHARRSTR